MRSFFQVKGVFSTRNLVVMALMVALKVVLAQFTIPVTPQFKLFTLAYLPGAMVATLYGPWAALAFGLVGDTVGYFAKPFGPYFIGYALSEMAANFIYACFLYRRPITYLRVALVRLVILVTVIFGLNFLWGSILSGSTASKFFTSVRLVNNLVQFPIYVMLSVWSCRLARRLEHKSSGSLIA